MDLGANAWMMIVGGLLALLGIFIWRRTSRYDLKGAALESAWQTVRGRRTVENPTALDQRWNEIRNEATVTGKARRTAGTVIGHFVAQFLGVVAMVMLAAGVILIAAGIWWR